MKKTHLLKLVITFGVVVMLISFAVIPDECRWYYEILLFNIGLWLWLFAKKELKKVKNSSIGLILITFFLIPVSLFAQDYSKQVNAFENSFHQKDISIIQPFLSDSLKFVPLASQNTLPILTNIVTKLPKLNSVQILSSEKGKIYVKYDFEQLGLSESEILFDENGKITKIEFVENLIQQQIEQQRKMQSSVQAPKPDKITFDYSKKIVEFPSKDGLTISADLYEIDPTKPIILLCHQAGYNKYEYADIAPRLNKMGFNALAIDQRSGGTFANQPNETSKRAIESGIENIDFIEAIQDIETAISFLVDKYHQKIIVWGSSYSSSLALHIAAKNKNVKAVISFSPGDYFGESLPSLQTISPNIDQPFLVTSSKEEASVLKELLNIKPENQQFQFIPDSDGFHGSKALWIDQKGADEYWVAIDSFLNKIKFKKNEK